MTQTITEVADGLWRVEGAPLKLPLGMRMPLASTVARLGDGSLLVYAPLRFDDDTAAELDRRGPVKHLFAPNLYHHLFLPRAKERWPHATVHAPDGLAAKRKDVTLDRTHGVDVDAALAGTFEQVTIDGAPKIRETVLFHMATGTLLCGDLLFNVTQPANGMTKTVLKMMGVGTQLGQSRIWKMLSKDRTATRGSAERILAWPIRAVAPCHGEVASIDSATLATKLQRMGL